MEEEKRIKALELDLFEVKRKKMHIISNSSIFFFKL